MPPNDPRTGATAEHRAPRRLAAALTLLLGLACTTPLELGERRYREGDRLAALEIWREVRSDSADFDTAQQRIAEVEREFQRLVTRYKNRARYYERNGRLAESMVNYRLALRLQPDDRDTLDHVQRMARQLAAQRTAEQERFRAAFESGDLREARESVERLRVLDPLSSEVATDERVVDEALRSRVDRLLARGRRRFGAGRHESAAETFKRVLELDPENEDAQGHLAYIARIRAEEERQSVSIDVEREGIYATDAEIRAEGLYQNGLAARRRGEPYLAIRYYRRALSQDSEHARARAELAKLRAELGPRVEELLERGRAAYQEEDLDGAIEHWDRALLIDPRNAQAREYRERARVLLRNLERMRSEPAAVGAPE